jgi:hypothetical protein
VDDSYKISLINMSTGFNVEYEVHHISNLVNEGDFGAGVCMFFDEFEDIIEVLASHDYIVEDVMPVVPENAMYYCIITSDDGKNDWVDYIFDGVRTGLINVMSTEKDIVIKISMSNN